MEKQYMTHEEVEVLLKEGYDKPRGWSRGKNQPKWHEKVFYMWRDMWRRCYDPTNISYPTYINAIVHDDFRIFSNYLSWVMSQPNFDEFCSTCHEISWSIDKKGHYFPELMSLCTKSENSKRRIKEHGSPLKSLDHHWSRVPIIGINIDDNTLVIFKSMSDTGYSVGNISRCCNDSSKTYKRYKWYYLDMNDRRD